MDAIIVADDSMIIQNIVEKGIGGSYKVLKAKHGKEAINYIIRNKEDNIIGMFLDLTMPEYDGFMVLQYFKNNNLFKKYPVVIISGDDTRATIDKAFRFDIVDMLAKPFSKDNIGLMIEKMKQFK